MGTLPTDIETLGAVYEFFGGGDQTRWNQIRAAINAGADALTGTLAPALTLLGKLDQNLTHSSQAAVEVLGGPTAPSKQNDNTFVAHRSDVTLELRVQCSVLGSSPGAYVLLVGRKTPAGGRIATRVALPVALPGVTEFLAEIVTQTGRETNGTYIGRVQLTGLTPGATYTYQVTAGTVSGVKLHQLSAVPAAAGMTITGDDAECWVCLPTPKQVVKVQIGGRPFWTLGLASDPAFQSGPADAQQWPNKVNTPIALGTTGNPSSVACSATRAVVVSTADPSEVTVITRATGAIEGTVAMPAGAGVALKPAITPDGVTAYIPTTTGRVYPMTLATRVFGSHLAIGGAPVLGNAAMTPDGSRLWVGNFFAGTVYSIPLPAFTTPTAVSVGAGGAPTTVPDPDGGVWVAGGDGTIRKVKTDLTVSSVTIPTTNQAGASGIVSGCALTGDGKIMYWSNGQSIGYSYTDDGAQFDKINTTSVVNAVGVTTDEYVFWALNTAGNPNFGSWSSAQCKINPIPDPFGDFNTYYLELWADGASPT